MRILSSISFPFFLFLFFSFRVVVDKRESVQEIGKNRREKKKEKEKTEKENFYEEISVFLFHRT